MNNLIPDYKYSSIVIKINNFSKENEEDGKKMPVITATQQQTATEKKKFDEHISNEYGKVKEYGQKKCSKEMVNEWKSASIRLPTGIEQNKQYIYM